MIKGVYARNRLPGLLNVPSVLVGNTDPDHRTGQHWVAIYANSRGEYYDPTGTPPFLRAYVNFMNKYCTSWTYNTIRVQEEGSTVCGYHYIFLPHSSMCMTVSTTYANILKYHIQGMPTNILLQVFI